MSTIKPSPDGYTCTACGYVSAHGLAAVVHDCPMTRPMPGRRPRRPTTRQAALMRLAGDAETLADKADALVGELTAAGASADVRARAGRCMSLMHQVMDEVMAMAREDDRG